MFARIRSRVANGSITTHVRSFLAEAEHANNDMLDTEHLDEAVDDIFKV